MISSFNKTKLLFAFLKLAVFLMPVFLFRSELSEYFYPEKFFGEKSPLVSGTLIFFRSEGEVKNNPAITLRGIDFNSSFISDGAMLFSDRQSVSVEVSMRKFKGTKLFADIAFDARNKLPITVMLAKEDGEIITAYSVNEIEHVHYDWTRELKDVDKYKIILISAPSQNDYLGSDVNYYPVLKYVSSQSFKPATLKIPSWCGVFALMLIGVLCFNVSLRVRLSDRVNYVMWILYFVLVFLCKASVKVLSFELYFYLVFGAIFIFLIMRNYRRRNAELIAFIGLGLILLIAFKTRWDMLIIHEGIRLEYDAKDYLDIATKYSKGVFDTAAERPPFVREPLYIWILKIGFLVLPKTPSGLKVISLLISIGAIYMFYLFSRRMSGILPALGATYMIAVWRSMANMSVQGLREDLFLLVISLFLFEIFLKKRRSLLPIRLGAVSALVLLVRISSFTFIFPMLVYAAFKKRITPLALISSILLTLCFIAPHLLFNYKFQDSKDLLFSANIHARYYRNLEFAGKPGYMTKEEFNNNPYGGAPVTTLSYLLKERSADELIKGAARGGIRIFVTKFTYQNFFNQNNILLIVYLSGMIFLLIFKRWEFYLIYFLMSLPVLYLANGILVERLVLYIAPFQALGMLDGWKRLADYVRSYVEYKKRVGSA